MRNFVFVTFIAALAVAVSCKAVRPESDDPRIAAAQRLCARLLPRQSRNVDFEIVPSDSCFFAFEAKEGRLKICGDNVNSLAVGLGTYIREWCKTDVTWFARDKVREPWRLPETEGRIVRKALVDNRFFLNYCTYGYSLPWWKWEDWERLIDWMAIHGVTLALANTAQESAWMETWKEFGLDEKCIREYFTGPAFLPWHRMTNIDHWHGPLPEGWMEGQKDLQRKIIAREMELGISPVLSAFSGHVPEALKEVFPEANITRLGRWSGFDESCSAWYLNPTDSLFGVIQRTYLEKQKELFGDGFHVYGVDLFNEVNPPSWDPDYLASAARETYATLCESDPDAVWLQMSWLFWHRRNMWTPERIEAYISPVPKGRLIMLDYYCEKVEIYRNTSNFYGQNFIWSYLGNFGGETMIAGDFRDTGKKISRVLEEASGECVGLGCTLEALDVNPVMYEYVLDRAWTQDGDDDSWIDRLADSRAGAADVHARKAWHILFEKVQKQISGHVISQIPARPSMDGTAKWNIPTTAYENSDLLAAWGELLQSGHYDTPSFRFDCVNWARQCLDNYFTRLYAELREAYKAGNADMVKAKGDRMLEIARDVDELVGADAYFLMGKWIEDARAWGESSEEKDYYETDARLLLTCWGAKGGILTDYANRDWNGLIGTYYIPRWEKYISGLQESLENAAPYDYDAFLSWCNDFEWNWAHGNNRMKERPSGSPRKLSERLYEKYKNEILSD